MSEQAPIRPEEPTTYVADPEQAEIMAYASKGAEDISAAANNKALAATDRLGEKGWVADLSAKREISKQFKTAEKHRTIAAGQANNAGELYSRLMDTAGVVSEKSKDKVAEPKSYIQDIEKAETMAYASRGAEEAGVEIRAKGKEALRNLDDKEWNSNGDKAPKVDITKREKAISLGKKVLRIGQGRSANREANHQLSAAQKTRELADKQAAAAGAIYDRFNKPITPKNRVEDPKRAEVMAYAMREKEEAAAAARALGLEAASNLGDKEWKSVNTRSAKREAKRQLKVYDRASMASFRKGELAGRTFDRHARFRSRAVRKNA